LQAPQSIEMALGGIARTAGFDQLRVQSEDFFVRAFGLQRGLIGLRRLDLSLGFGGLGPNVGVSPWWRWARALRRVAPVQSCRWWRPRCEWDRVARSRLALSRGFGGNKSKGVALLPR